MSDKVKRFLSHPLLSNRRLLLGIWIILSLAGMLKFHRSYNNFLIFKGVYWHTVNGTSLYAAYPTEYGDVNHYGPLFSLIIAPFAILPEWIGMLLWLLFLSGWLFAAIYWSGLRKSQQVYIYWFCGFTLLTALFMQQFNIAIAAIILSSFFLIEKEHEGWAAFFYRLRYVGETLWHRGISIFSFFTAQGTTNTMVSSVVSNTFFSTNGNQFARLYHRTISRMVQQPCCKEYGKHSFDCAEYFFFGDDSSYNGLYKLFWFVAYSSWNGTLCPSLSPFLTV